MNHEARQLSEEKPPSSDNSDNPDNATERELIDMEFQSMVEGLSLDESAPSTYLDELDNFVDQNRFIAPAPAPRSFIASIKSAINSFKRWKDGKDSRDGDGAQL
jgi:hypothetical protein